VRAVYYETHGDAQVLQVGELERPACGPTQVLIEVAAAGVNPIDRRLRAGELQEYIQRTFPVVPGFDVAGRIAEVGSEVVGWQVGDEVMGLAFTWSIQHGTYAEFAPVEVSAITRKPVNATFIQAAGIPLVSLTAWQSLLEFGQLGPGKTVLIQAGAGGVGSVAIPMAKHLGATVYTTASAANADYVRALGADVVIDYQQEPYESALLKAEPDGVDLVLEALLGDGTDEAAIRITKSGGAVAYMNNEPPDMPDIEARAIRAEFIHHRADGAMLEALVHLYEQGLLPLPLTESLPLALAVEAHRRSESRRTRGKLVLSVAEF
jgi:NADPH:quinone reductase-like Zn-dependent oxidoreductase